jgi:hypothetical protein
MKKLGLLVSLVAVLTVMVGCSALDKLKNGDSTGKGNLDLSGSWEIVATSNSPASSGVVTYLEFNAKQNGSALTAPVEVFSVNGNVGTFANCFGVTVGNPQGNITATVNPDNIQGSFTETGAQGSVSFDINAPLSSPSSFSSTYASLGGNVPPACSDSGTYVATQTGQMTGTYTGMLTYPDGTQEMMNLAATEDYPPAPSYGITVTGNATGGSQDGAISLTGTVTGNLARLHGTSSNGHQFSGWAWWHDATQNLDIVDDNGYSYGSLKRQ